ncbi:MAG: 5-bromo-4-chloroindolyl phosphate hydrolysis family protein [Lachnospiraceae bacterium]|nr:5-bromo-4-chloroindolyl phosphate hydrolysis family protein [Lachnospiraceae bacterium]
MNKDLQDLLDVGSDILKSVTSAVDGGNYSNLASDISRAVRNITVNIPPANPAGRRPGRVVTARPDTVRNRAYTSGLTPEAPAGSGGRAGQPGAPGGRTPRTNGVRHYFLQRNISKSAGVLQMVGFGLSSIIFGAVCISMLAAGTIAGAIFGAVATAGSVFGFLRGNRTNNLAQRYYQYGNILGNSEYFNISDLAGVVFRTDREVLKDIKQMIKRGFLPRARLDRDEKICMITDRSYQMYMGAIEDQEARQMRDQRREAANRAVNGSGDQDSSSLSPEVRSILKEGNEYIIFVRQVNDIIPDTEEMSNKLYRLENIMNRIFDQVKKEPSSADELYKLMNYYLPTTKKLLTAYIELDKQPGVGDNITKTKLEIDSAMDTINEAFEKLLNSLFQDMAWDISSDISVMKTMMAQDGLMEDSIAKK